MAARIDAVTARPGRRLPPSPLIYEINTWPWLTELSTREGRDVDLGSVPGIEWDRLATLGFDAVWMMGVWRRSVVGVEIALADAALMEWFADSLAGFTPDDVVGSPYSVADYVVDEHLGGPDGLAVARAELARRGIGLILDYVPNHVAPDHSWTADPTAFITGSADDLAQHGDSFVAVGDAVLANGRDPYFPAWQDTVQVNAFSPVLRELTIDAVRAIATRCDGVRCDMAMLMMNDVFARTWGDRAGPRPADEFWPRVIAAVRADHPEFRFIAEAYWDTESALAAQGFDHCYDKSLYDTLVHEPSVLWARLPEDASAQRKLLRFIENHDEPRASRVFGERDRLAAVVTLTQIGARLIHHGQIEGRRIRVPVQLRRFPDEPVDADRAVFYRALLGALADETFRAGEWRRCASDGDVVAWSRSGPGHWVVAVNVGDDVASGTLAAPIEAQWENPLTGEVLRPRDDRLRVSLGPWGWQLYRAITPSTTES
ncbi:alpha-amylase family glycosyl hydrolase [Gordonia sp. CPCC 205515]|uniref:alpha-amylase family glycosyl hydrolase n=1 Tax=Gordonia sp. CPCC 205515 TaxID=3140791 RepID=UPI003AF3EA09